MTCDSRTLCSYGNGRTAVASFIAAPLTSIHRELDAWVPIGGYEYRVRPGANWRDVFLDGVAPPERCALIPTASRWTALVDNDPIGGWPLSTLFVMSERLRTDCCSFVMSRPGANPTARSFGYWDGRRGTCESRTVQLIRDSRWEFHASGRPLPFEDLERYGRRLKRDRFTNEMVIRYARELGIELEDSHFFLCEGREVVFDCVLLDNW